MKVCIVTVYNSENCGSYMQARMLGKQITDLGHEIIYLYRKRHVVPPDNWHFFKQQLKGIMKLRFGAVRNRSRYFKTFKDSEKDFQVIAYNTVDYDTIDCFVVGSDTMWNLDSDHFFENREYYWGQKMKGKPVITYAVSVSNTSKEKIESLIPVREWLKNFTAISVRDKHTKEVIESFTDQPIEMVCDPTLLVEPEQYSDLITMPISKPFILLYCFVDIQITEEMQQNLIAFAKQHNMEIISYGMNRKWCDKSVCYDPKTFLSYFSQASFIVTNTFHGVMFSMIFNREFMAIGKEKIKVREALETHGLSDRLQEQTVDIEKIYQQKIDYGKVNTIIAAERQKGIGFLKNAFEEIENEKKE